jgi:hypothetical protein
MNENWLFAQSRHNRLLSSLLSLEKRTTCANFLDANQICVAPERWVTGGLAFGSIERVCKEKDIKDGSFLAWLHPTRRVASCR